MSPTRLALRQLAQDGAGDGVALIWSAAQNRWVPDTPTSPTTVVQHKSNKCSPGTSVTVTLDTAPTVGNVLLALVGYYVGQTLTATGFTAQHSYANGNAATRIYSRIVTGGDGTGWTISQSGSDSMTVILLELAGSDATPAGWGYSDGTGSNTVTATAGHLLIAFGSSDGGAGNGVTTITPTGYTSLEQQIPNNHTGIAGDAVGTGASQTLSTAWNGSPNPLASVVVDITP